MSRHCNYRRNRPQSRILFGAIVIVVGVVALLGNFGVLDARAVLHFWPTIFIIFGMLKLSQSHHPAGYAVGGAFVATGTLMMLNNAGIINFHMRDWWPLFVILGGVLILFKGMSRDGRDRQGHDDSGMPDGEQVMHADRLNTTAVMSGANIKSDTQDFHGGELTAVMGGIELDLRQASIRTEAVLNVFAFWGGIAIKVPADWSVVAHGVPLLGGIDDKTVPPMNPAKRLVIEGYVIMGGLEIRN
jgi:predicted membrane protein